MTPEIGDFLHRLVRLDPAAVVRIHGTELWGRVPWNVLVARTTSGSSGNRTVSAAAWLALDGDDPSDLPSLDRQWRTGLPPAAHTVVETIPAGVLRKLATAAADTLRETADSGLGGRAVGARILRDALLDHVPIVVVPEDVNAREIRVPQRLVQAVARMDFLGGDEDPTHIVVAGPWVGIVTGRGVAWWRAEAALTLHPHRA